MSDIAGELPLEQLAWPQIDVPVSLLVPLGSTEQHGPHLPTGTDTVIAVAVCVGVRSALDTQDPGRRALVAPAQAYGSSGEHQDFPGTLSIGTDALVRVIVELVRSASTWAERIVLVNAHGGNAEALRRAVPQLITESHRVGWVTCGIPGSDAHAGAAETSLMLHLSPGQVRTGRVQPGIIDPISEILPRLRTQGVRAVSRSGILGDPTTATAGAGARMLARVVTNVVAAVEQWQPRPDGRLTGDPMC